MADPRMSIHPTAIVDSGAELGADVKIGPYCHVGAGVRLHDGVTLKSHVTVDGATEIGARTYIHPFAVIGEPPQHIDHKGEKTLLKIGEDNVIREHVTMNPGTVAGGGVTSVGNRGLFMINAHIAHDCIVGDDVIIANNSALGGHTIIEEGVFVGALVGVHQRCRVGAYAFIGGCSAVNDDIIPYGSAMGNHARLGGLNVVGMKRRGVSRDVRHNLRKAYKVLFADTKTLKERVEIVREQFGDSEEVMRIVNFVADLGPRSLMTPRD